MHNQPVRSYPLRFTVVVLLLAFVAAAAFIPDEGMFAPDQISKLPLKKRGLKISPSELYDPDKPSISDAIVRVNIGTGGFGTGEFVSRQGLILTNHHVGFDALVEASTPERDLAGDGFSAKSRSDELPAKGYSAIITDRVENVTSKVLAGTEGLDGDAKDSKVAANIAALEAAAVERTPGTTVSVQELDEGYYYYLYQTRTLNDIRVVYAPPRSIGFFGGDPDNFEWTRHTGDFTFLRAYVGPDGSPAEYSPDNVPFEPKRSLQISLAGIDEGDFVMVMGYPGGTTRFRESATINYAEQVNFPFIAEYVETWSETLSNIAAEEPDKAIEFEAQIFNLNNAAKLYAGNVEAMTRTHIVERRRQQESEIMRWIAADPARKEKYGDLFGRINAVAEKYYRTSARNRAIQIFPSTSSTIALSAAYLAVNSVIGGGPELTAERKEQIKGSFEGWEPALEREMIAFFLRRFDALPQGQRFAPVDALFQELEGRMRREAEHAFADRVVDEFGSPEKIFAVYESSPESLRKKYPRLVELALSLKAAKTQFAESTAEFNEEIAPLRLLYIKALNESGMGEIYPDANSTLRFSFGNVKGYSPREAVTYHPFTTLAGVLEKDRGTEPFLVTEELKELFRKKDYGVYGKNGTMPVNFLSDTDIIGGNSGSPVMNGRGEQVGIVFDGNYEGLGNDMFFDPARGRTIAVDIRYVLFITEKLGKSGWILDEMDVKKKK